MSDTRKIEEQTKEELLKDCELSLEDLGKVTGGTGGVFEQNPDGTYNIYEGQSFYYGASYCVVLGTYLNATLDTSIYFECYYSFSSPNGESHLVQEDESTKLRYLIDMVRAVS
mgnify:FL=1